MLGQTIAPPAAGIGDGPVQDLLRADDAAEWPDNLNAGQQAAMARFGEFALKTDDLGGILQEACRLVGHALGTHLAKVMELEPGGATMLVRAGVGWKPGVVGEVRLALGDRTAESLALQTGEAVLSADVDQEERFDYPPFIRDNGVRALATVIIVGAECDPPYGVLQVDSRVPRAFTGSDTLFLRNYANLLAAAVTRLRMTAALRDRADEKDRLLCELQHRVKNNLQTVMALVRRSVRRARGKEALGALRAVGDGIEALRLIHDRIYRTDGAVDRICLGSYLVDLTSSLLAFHGSDVVAKIRLVSDATRFDVVSDVATPFGLITSEFVTNSLRHAFGEDRGTIGVRVAVLPETLQVMLWDDGKGLPEEPPDGTGIKLIEGLARQVGGTVSWAGGNGTSLTISVPIASLDGAS